MLKRINDHLAKAEFCAIGVILLAMTALAFLQVLSRYILKTSYPWLEEAVRFLMFWLTYIGVPLLIYKSGNIHIDFIPELLRDKLKIDITPIIDLAVLIFMLYFLKQATIFIQATAFYAQKSQVMSLPMQYIYSVFVIGNTLAVFHAVSTYILKIMEWRKNR